MAARTKARGPTGLRRALGGVLAALALLPALAAAADAREDAARQAIDQAIAGEACRGIGDFYWEIGDANGMVLGGQSGRRYTAERVIPIASASKWVFGAFVVQRTGGKPSPAQIEALEMRSGYDGQRPLGCMRTQTADECWQRSRNARFNPDHVGKFSYNGGHDEKLLIDMGLGGLNLDALSAELRRTLGDDLAFQYGVPDPAGGLRASPATYASFLRKILRGELLIAGELGSHPVCTLPGTCADAVESPVPRAWHYSLNHWVEDDPQYGDGSFSSPGAFGFYPWISADRKYYGIVARESLQPKAAVDSVMCGIAIRQAFFSATKP